MFKISFRAFLGTLERLDLAVRVQGIDESASRAGVCEERNDILAIRC